MGRQGKSGGTAGAGAARRRRLVNSERAMASLEKAASFWEERARQMREAVEAMRNQMREAERGVAMGLAAYRRGPGRPPGSGRKRLRQGVAAACVEILRDWGRPGRVGELLPELAKRGIRVGGKKPMATLASTLLKYPGVKKAGRGLFVPATKGE